MTEQELNELRNRVGEKKFQEILDHPGELRKANKSPDEIAEALQARFPEIGASGPGQNRTPINVSAVDA